MPILLHFDGEIISKYTLQLLDIHLQTMSLLLTLLQMDLLCKDIGNNEQNMLVLKFWSAITYVKYVTAPTQTFFFFEDILLCFKIQ